MEKSLPECIGRYQVIDEIGLGAMGSVYKAFDPLIKRHLAIKTIRVDLEVGSEEYKSFLDRFHQEARIAGTLNHPNIITIYDIGEEKGMPFLAFEYIEGEPLSGIIVTKVPLKSYDVILIISQVASALDYAHSRSIIHRDVKPSNILIHGGNRVKVLDFGISKFGEADLTKPGMRLGTPCYMSPEQALGERVDHRSDLFSMAAMAFELLTGKPPFEGDSTTAVLYGIVHSEPPRAANLDAQGLLESRWENLFQKALSKDREKRFQKGEDFVRALWECQKGAFQTYDSFVQSSLDMKRSAGGPVPERTIAVAATPQVGTSTPASSQASSGASKPAEAIPKQAPVLRPEESPATVMLPQQRKDAAREPEAQAASIDATRVTAKRKVEPPIPSPTDSTVVSQRPSISEPPSAPVSIPTAQPQADSQASPDSPPQPIPATPPQPVPAAPSAQIPRRKSPADTRIFMIALAVILMVGMAATGYYFFSHRGTAPEPEPPVVIATPQTQPIQEPPPPPMPVGSFELHTTPEGASVFINGEAKGITPVTLSALQAGQYILRFELKGFEPIEQTREISVDAREVQIVQVPLKASPPVEIVGSMKVISEPAGANIVLDGKNVGTTPKVLTKIRTGKHVLELTLDGYVLSVSQPIVKTGRQTEVTGKLQAVPPPPPPLPPPVIVEPKETGPLELSPDIKFERRPVSGEQPEAPKVTTGRVSGSVLVKIIVGVSGDVENVDVQQSGGGLLDGIVVRTVSKWRFKPATKNGMPVSVFFLYRFTFK